MDPAEEVLGIEVACDQYAPGVVREAIARLEGAGWILGDAMLVASELVTNAVRHSGCRATEVLDVRITSAADGLTISVHDPGHSGKSAAIARQDETAIGGLGLRVVEAIARRWGSERRSGYRVWAEVPAISEG